MSNEDGSKSNPATLSGDSKPAVSDKLLFSNFTREDGSDKTGHQRLLQLNAEPTASTAGALTAYGTKKDGSYVVTSEIISDTLPPITAADDAARKEIKVNVAGVFDIIGYLVIETFELGIQLNVLGISIGNFYGNAGDGVTVNLDLLVAGGMANFYISDLTGVGKGRELRVKYKLSLVMTAEVATSDVVIFAF